MKLKDFLANKPLFYDEIDYLRMPKAYENIKDFLPLVPVIHVVGTNGKGSTGRFLAMMINDLGFRVGHYTSRHIFDYNERFYKNGKIISDEELEYAHKFLFEILNYDFKDSLIFVSYTLLFLRIT